MRSMNIDIDFAGIAIAIGTGLLVADMTPEYRGPGWIAFGAVGFLFTAISALRKRRR